jgi:hypothetical protein
MRISTSSRLATLVLTFTALAAASTDLSAQTKAKPKRSPVVDQYSGNAPPITVKRRSFLDPGPVVPVGSMSNYVNVSTVLSRTEDQTFKRSYFGNEALPAPLEIPARAAPLVVFEPLALPN